MPLKGCPLSAAGAPSFQENRTVSTQEDLESQGWQRQTTFDEPRLSEAVETYEEIGFEVRLEPFDPKDEPGCIECMKVSPEKYQTVYTRKKS